MPLISLATHRVAVAGRGLLVFALALPLLGSPVRAELVTYSFTGIVEEVSSNYNVPLPAWGPVGTPIRGIVRWETGLADSDPEPSVGSYFSPAGAVFVDFGPAHGVTTTSAPGTTIRPLGIDLGLNVVPDPVDADALFSVGNRSVRVLFEIPQMTDDVPTSLTPEGSHSFVYDSIYYEATGSITSLKRIDFAGEWSGMGTGLWSDPNNWQVGFVPNELGVKATLGPNTSGPTEITLDSPVELTDLVLDSALDSYDINGTHELNSSGERRWMS